MKFAALLAPRNSSKIFKFFALDGTLKYLEQCHFTI